MSTSESPSSFLPCVFLLILQVLGASSLSAGQAYVCPKTTYYKASKSQSYKQPFRIKTYTWCWAVPPRCTNYLMRYRTAYRQVWETKSKTVYECCRGYANAGGVCKPVCSFSCGYGQCTSPNVCTCHSGYSGLKCADKCNPWYYGSGCTKTCPCIQSYSDRCDPTTGTCTCKPGYKGITCGQKCTVNVNYGRDCKGLCKCKNSATCDFKTGACTCKPGWDGQFCSKPCGAGTGGQGCSPCKCQNGVCDRLTGFCSTCDAGWKGSVCSMKCLQGSWGVNCAKKCDCNGGKCAAVDGKCSDCPAGYTGQKCDQPCPTGKYGPDCKKTCQCKNGGICERFAGNCTCKDPGFYGRYCEVRYCGSKKVYGLSKLCDKPCKCVFKNTLTQDAWSCHSITGACTCQAGWKGQDCSIPCSAPFYGLQCSQTCNCTNSAYCDPILGKCYCQLGYRGRYCEHRCGGGTFGLGCGQNCECYHGASCNPVTGACICKAGWTGIMCERTCKKGTHGVNCTDSCDCNEKYGNGCHPKDGTCLCKPGTTGAKCDKQCQNGKFGLGCAQDCDCLVTNVCVKDTGICLCQGNSSGPACTSACPRGRWGTKCEKLCNCNGSPCTKDIGTCKCAEPGFTGTDCKTPCPTGFFGMGCKQKCTHCTPYGSLPNKCDVKTGRCTCKNGFFGFFCERSCSAGLYGKTCTDKCNVVCPQVQKTVFVQSLQNYVKQNFTIACDPSTGKCLCPAGRLGDKCEKECPRNTYGIKCLHQCDCDPVGAASCRDSNGLCVCKAGYTGPKCNEGCPQNYYGQDCKKKCACNNAGSVPKRCKMVTGLCYCKSGWQRSFGQQCDQRCSIQSETWGPNCIWPCPKCPPNSQCNIENGKCDCYPGYHGFMCTQKCSYPYFGLNCAKQCDVKCPQQMCDYKGGCLVGPPGKIVDGTPGPAGPITEDELGTGTLVGIIVGIVLLVLLIIMLALIFYFRRKVGLLRQQKKFADQMRDEALTAKAAAVDGGIQNPTYDHDVQPLPAPIKGVGTNDPKRTQLHNNLTYMYGQQRQNAMRNEDDAYDPYDTIGDNLAKAAPKDGDEPNHYTSIGDAGTNPNLDVNRPEGGVPADGYLPMTRAPAPLPTVTASAYVDPYSMGPKTPTDPTYHNAYEIKAPPRLQKPPVSKKPNIPIKTGETGPNVPDNAYQRPNPAMESPYRDAYDLNQEAGYRRSNTQGVEYSRPNPAMEDPYRNAYDHRPGAAPEQALRSGPLIPSDLDDIMGDTPAEAQGYDKVPVRNDYDQPKLGRNEYDQPNLKPRPVTNVDFQADMDELMDSGSVI